MVDTGESDTLQLRWRFRLGRIGIEGNSITMTTIKRGLDSSLQPVRFEKQQ